MGGLIRFRIARFAIALLFPAINVKQKPVCYLVVVRYLSIQLMT